jgi:hypothetical protein
MPDDFVAVKIDLSNAFNCIRRDSVLAAVADSLPEIYRFCHLAYHRTSILQYDQHPLLTSLCIDLVLGYLDDFTLGGPLNTVAADVASIRNKGASLSRSLNAK